MIHMLRIDFDRVVFGVRQAPRQGGNITVGRWNTHTPGGDIVFVSDRSNFGSQCAGAMEQDNMILNLYRCDPDGRNIRPLSNNKDFDRHPHVMDTGQLLFLHWEYQEHHLWQTHTLWTSSPIPGFAPPRASGCGWMIGRSR